MVNKIPCFWHSAVHDLLHHPDKLDGVEEQLLVAV
jgi:hypothetical protein